MAEKVRRRLGDSELDSSKHKGMSQMQFWYREEWWLQSHDMSEVQARILLDMHGTVVRTWPKLVQL